MNKTLFKSILCLALVSNMIAGLIIPALAAPLPSAEKGANWLVIKQESYGGCEYSFEGSTWAIIGLDAVYRNTHNATYLQSAVKGADRLLLEQSGDGGFSSEIRNTAFGLWSLCEVYKGTGKAVYLTAASRAGDWLIGAQKSGGSFDYYESETAVSVLALTKLYECSQQDKYKNAAINAAGWLVSQQKLDGSFDEIIDTSESVAALVDLYWSTSRSPYNNSAMAGAKWLSGVQHSDGSWGSITETCWALFALSETGLPTYAKATVNAENYLERIQENDGSWGEVKYTGMAVSAIKNYYDYAHGERREIPEIPWPPILLAAFIGLLALTAIHISSATAPFRFGEVFGGGEYAPSREKPQYLHVAIGLALVLLLCRVLLYTDVWAMITSAIAQTLSFGNIANFVVGSTIVLHLTDETLMWVMVTWQCSGILSLIIFGLISVPLLFPLRGPLWVKVLWLGVSCIIGLTWNLVRLSLTVFSAYYFGLSAFKFIHFIVGPFIDFIWMVVMWVVGLSLIMKTEKRQRKELM